MSNTAEQMVETKVAEEEEEGGEAEADTCCCANCGIAEVDDIKLEECTDCDLVKYCGDNCRDEHREKHEEECKNRKALLHDRKLFTQPDEAHEGECPLCFLPLPINGQKSAFYTCCSQTICKGCVYANFRANKHDRVKAGSCPFCREPAACSDEETHKRNMKRVKAKDPAALSQKGISCHKEGDYDASFEYFTKAAKLGDADAHYRLGYMYGDVNGVEKVEKKTVYHWEKAAIGGHPQARHNLAIFEKRNGNIERAVKHFIIAANLGYDNSMKALWKQYSEGSITKEDLDATLRTHQAAIDATKSKQREEAEAFFRKHNIYCR